MNSNFNHINTAGLCMVLMFFICFRGVSSFPSGEESNIAGGGYARPGEFPYQVSLKSRNYLYKSPNSSQWQSFTNIKGQHFCGGAIIRPDIVLSAAHCFDDAIVPAISCPNREYIIRSITLEANVIYRDIYVLAGIIDNNDTDDKNLQMSDVKSTLIHPGYEKGMRYCSQQIHADLALVFLSTPFQYNSFVRPIELARHIPIMKTYCEVTGWGKHEKGDDGRDNLLKKATITVDRQHILSHSIFVDHRTSFGQSSCQGDSGGPLVCDGQVIGVTSRSLTSEGLSCPTKAAHYESVPFYKNQLWLKRTILEHELGLL